MSGFEPLTCRLQEGRPTATRTLPALTAQPNDQNAGARSARGEGYKPQDSSGDGVMSALAYHPCLPRRLQDERELLRTANLSTRHSVVFVWLSGPPSLSRY